jgi:hypothetical protein
MNEQGASSHFSGAVSHLYDTENSGLSFHALVSKAGLMLDFVIVARLLRIQ